MDDFAAVYTCKVCCADMLKHARLCPDCLKAERAKVQRKTQAPCDNIASPWFINNWQPELIED